MAHEFKVPSGLTCKVKDLTAGHQEDLTKGGSVNLDAKLNALLKDVIIEFGGKSNLSDEDVLDILSADRKKILFELRQYSLDFDPNFKFTYKYTEGGEKKEIEQEVDLSDGLPERPFYKTWETFEEMKGDKVVEVVLPKSEQRVKFKLLDGRGTMLGSAIKKADLNVNSGIVARSPQVFHKLDGDGKELWLKLDPRKLSLKDVEFLRRSIKDHEGQVDTELMFENPVQGEQDVVVDMLGQVAFFFPSEAI
jgi:hypothetical protein